MNPLNVWIAIGVTAVGCYLVKYLGLSAPAGVLERPLVKRLAALLPVALLAALQGEDGGWPISWRAWAPGTALEGRPIVTLEALLTLRAYGRPLG